jgi:hypothetical protein
VLLHGGNHVRLGGSFVKVFNGVAVSLVLSVGLAACAHSTDASDKTPVGAAAVVAFDQPTGKTILSIDGAISEHNEGKDLALDVASIEQLPLQTVTVLEPFVQQDIEFTGVLLSDVLAAAGMSPDAAVLSMTALDDYHVDFTLSQIDTSRVLLATRSSGAVIPISDGGPARIVFLSDDGLGANSDNWIWSVTRIEVKR